MKLAIRKRTEDFASLMTIALSASRSLQNGRIYLLSNSLGEKEGNKKKKKQLVYVSSFLPCYCVSKIEASKKDLVVKLLWALLGN